MRVIKGHPTVSGQDAEQRKKILPLAIGWTTYITEEVEVAPAVDILFITSQPLKMVNKMDPQYAPAG